MNKKGDIMWDSSSYVKFKNLTGIEKVFAERKNPFHKVIEPHRFMKKRGLNLQMKFSNDKLQNSYLVNEQVAKRIANVRFAKKWKKISKMIDGSTKLELKCKIHSMRSGIIAK